MRRLRRKSLATILYNFCHIIARKRSFHAINVDDRPLLCLPFTEWARPDTQTVDAQSPCASGEKECVIMLRHRRRRQVDCIGPGEFLAFRHVLLSNTLYRVAYFNPLFSGSERMLQAPETAPYLSSVYVSRLFAGVSFPVRFSVV